MPQSRRLLLIAPGLLGPVTDTDAVAALRPRIPPLEAMLARADTLAEASPDFEAAVFAAFSLGGRGLPVAAVSRLGESDGGTAHVGESYWLRADPVHLRVDTHNARLFGARVLQLDEDEAEALVARLDAHFRDDGLRFERVAADRWYVAAGKDFDLRAWSPRQVAGRNIDAFLPTGADADRWRRWMNEAQMLLHDAPQNAEREARGRLPVNSFWPWGGGRLPVEPLETVPAAVWSNEPVARGLARMAQLQARPVPPSPADLQLEAGANLVVHPDLIEPLVHGEVEDWLDALERFAADWLAPLYQRLRAGDLDELTVAVDASRRFRLQPGHRRRWWRRRRPWTHWLERE